MFEARTDISIDNLKPSMRDLKGIKEAPVGEGVVAAVKADGECAFRLHASLSLHLRFAGERAPISACSATTARVPSS